jgi:hypothetical protein
VNVQPIVRYMILCDDCDTDSTNARRVNIRGLLTNIRALDQPAYPLLYRQLCVFVALTDGRGTGTAKVVCILEDSGQPVFETHLRDVNFGPDPLDVVGVPFRILDCPFPYPGMYSVQFWYIGAMLAERPLRLR